MVGEERLFSMCQVDRQKDGGTRDFGADVVRHIDDGAEFWLIIDELL